MSYLCFPIKPQTLHDSGHTTSTELTKRNYMNCMGTSGTPPSVIQCLQGEGFSSVTLPAEVLYFHTLEGMTEVHKACSEIWGSEQCMSHLWQHHAVCLVALVFWSNQLSAPLTIKFNIDSTFPKNTTNHWRERIVSPESWMRFTPDTFWS